MFIPLLAKRGEGRTGTIQQDEDMLVATCHEPEMATQGGTLDELLAVVRDLIRCRFDEKDERLNWPTYPPQTPG